MIRHVVLFKLKAGVTSDDLDRWLAMSRRAHNRIESVRAFSIGTDLMHLPVIELSRELSEHIASVDFEV